MYTFARQSPVKGDFSHVTLVPLVDSVFKFRKCTLFLVWKILLHWCTHLLHHVWWKAFFCVFFLHDTRSISILWIPSGAHYLIPFTLGVIHLGRPAKIGIFRPPLPRLSGLNNRIPLKITIDVRFFKTPPPPGKPDVLNGWPLTVRVVAPLSYLKFALILQSSEQKHRQEFTPETYSSLNICKPRWISI